MQDLTTLDRIRLRAGAGDTLDALCVMQATDYVTSGGTSDHPACVSPVITSFMINWNDGLQSDDDRARLLRPLIPSLINTRTTEEHELTRSWLALDWLVRVQMPAWLRLTPALVPHAEAVAALPVLASRAALDAAWPTISAARDASAAAWDAARAAAWDAARAAARDACAETVAALQLSAQQLVRDMCAVGHSAVVAEVL